MELLDSPSIPKALLAMGIPTMIGMLVNAFYNLVDNSCLLFKKTLDLELAPGCMI